MGTATRWGWRWTDAVQVRCRCYRKRMAVEDVDGGGVEAYGSSFRGGASIRCISSQAESALT